MFYEIYVNALRSRDYYSGALRQSGQNPYSPLTQQWGSESGTSFDEFMKEVTEITRNARLTIKLRKAA